MKLTFQGEPFWGMPSDDVQVIQGSKRGKPAVAVQGWIRNSGSAAANTFILTDPREVEALGEALVVVARNMRLEAAMDSIDHA